MQFIQEKHNHLKNLFSVAIADNEVDASEIKLLYDLGMHHGLTADEIDSIIASPEKIEFIKPESFIDAISQLYDLVSMVLADGKIQHEEIEVCKGFAKRFDINNDVIDELIDKLINEIRSGASKQNLINDIINIL